MSNTLFRKWGILTGPKISRVMPDEIITVSVMPIVEGLKQCTCLQAPFQKLIPNRIVVMFLMQPCKWFAY
jgi:hypothetical protein